MMNTDTLSSSKNISFKELIGAGGVCGILLLIRPFIYMIFSRRRDLNAYSTVDFSAVIFILFAFICFIFSLRELNRSSSAFGRSMIIASPIIWLLLYTLLGGFSMFWSVDFKLSGFRVFECLSLLLLIVAVIQRLFIEQSHRIVIQWTITFIVLDVLVALVRRSMWAPDIWTLLEASQMMATTFFFLSLYADSKKWYHYLIMILSIFSMSTVSYVGMFLGLLSLFFSNSRYRVVIAACGVILISLFFAFGPTKILKSTVFFDKSDISLSQTSGRDKIMNAAIESLESNPWGYGYTVGELVSLRRSNLNAINSHNSLFSAAMGLGYPGLILMLLFLINMCRIVLFSRYIPPNYKAMLVGCFCVGFLHCMGNPGLGSRVYGSWIPVCYLFTLICGFYINGKYYKK